MDTKVPYKYLYVDDESGNTVQSFADGLSKDGVIVEYKHVSKFDTDYIKKMNQPQTHQTRKNQALFNAFILDCQKSINTNHVATYASHGDIT